MWNSNQNRGQEKGRCNCLTRNVYKWWKWLTERGYIVGYVLIGTIHHKQYSRATCEPHEDIGDTSVVHEKCFENIHIQTTTIGSMMLTNAYKPPNNKWISNLMNTFEHPAVYVSDFNNHNMA